MNTFQQYLKSYFSQPGSLSQKEVASRAKIHFVGLNRIVNGHQVPTLTTAEAIAKATGSTLGKIYLKKTKTKLVSA